MTDDNNKSDPIKKHWLIILIILPVILALIAILPNLMKSSNKTKDAKAENIEMEITGDQSTQIGTNNGVINIGQGDNETTEKKP